ncbi:glutamyl-tRNA synthetase [Infundibulicybe gibba]|nr:glutamyl-tRNA synthetase [Infundibulicybe gibba]
METSYKRIGVGKDTGLRMALYNHLFAKKHGGEWILRIEDTDATRFVPGSVDGIRKSLEWAGLQYDYGPGKHGPHAPYFQSERRDLYQSYARKLLDSGHAYRCFCSMDTLASTREKLARSGSNSTYDKACLHLTDEEVARKVRAGEKSIVRLNDSNLPVRPPASDIVFGALKMPMLDDHEMGITHVLRGEEWLTSLPLHLDLYACLGIPRPEFAHIPLLLNADGTKMSKRNGDVQVIDYIRRGWEPEALLNWLALAGWGVRYESTPSGPISHPSSHPRTLQEAPDSTSLMNLKELIDQFDLSALTQRSSSLDSSKLEYINKHHLARAWSDPQGLTLLAERVHDQVKAAFPASQYTNIEYIKRVILNLESRLTNIQDIPGHAPYLFVEPDLETDEARAMLSRVTPEQRVRVLEAVGEVVRTAEPWGAPRLLDLLHSEREQLGISNKVFMTVLRHALSGMKDGPAVADTMEILGRERTLVRLK